MSRPAASKDEKKMLILKSSDNEDFEVEESVAIQSLTIKNLIDNDCIRSVIPLPNVTSKTLAKVIKYLDRHADSKASEDDLKTFDKEFILEIFPDSPDEFIKRMLADKGFMSETTSDSLDEFINLMLAGHYLDINGIVDITCQKVADCIKDLSVADVRKCFKVENDYTPEEEEKARNENAWAFE